MRTLIETSDYLAFTHSIEKPLHRKTINPGDVKYVLLDVHGSHNMPFPIAVEKHLPQDNELMQHLNSLEADAGVPALTNQIVQQVPGGMGIHVNVARSILDGNRILSHAVRGVLHPDAPAEVKNILADIHRQFIDSIDRFIASLHPKTKLVCLHSMWPNTPVNQQTLAHDPESIRAYIYSYESCLNSGVSRNVCFISPPEANKAATDVEMTNAFGSALNQTGIHWEKDKPFRAEAKDQTTRYALNHPHHTFIVDIPKHLLCEGERTDKTFSCFSKPDSSKVNKIALSMAEALSRTLHGSKERKVFSL